MEAGIGRCVYGKFFAGKAGFVSLDWWADFCNYRRSVSPVPEDFVYPCDRHGNEYGWGWSLLTTPEMLYGRDACTVACSPEESFRRIVAHLRGLLPDATNQQIVKMIK